MRLPSIYRDGYHRAKSIDPSLADSYIAHTQLGDSLADAVMPDLGDLPPKEVGRLVGGAVEQDERVLRAAPESLRRLIHEMSVVPPWYDRAAAQRGCRAFLRNSDHMLEAYVAGAIVDGFATMISKSFAITGRLVHDGVRRLKQNVRHLLDIFMPRGVEPLGDGWKLTLRIRIVHARIRWLFRQLQRVELPGVGCSDQRGASWRCPRPRSPPGCSTSHPGSARHWTRKTAPGSCTSGPTRPT